MGSIRPRPARLAEKLLIIRQKIDGGLSQNQLIKRMHLEDELEQDRISKFERGLLEPPLYVLCAYADAANVLLEVIVKDELDLPSVLPALSKDLKLLNPSG